MTTGERTGARWLDALTNSLFEMGQESLRTTVQVVLQRMIKEKKNPEQIRQEVIDTIVANWARRQRVFSDYGVSEHEKVAIHFITKKIDTYIDINPGFSWNNIFYVGELSRDVWSQVVDYEPESLQNERANESSVRKFFRRRLGI